MSGEELSLHVGKWTGYRVWKAFQVEGDVLLRSYAQDAIWRPGDVLEAECKNALALRLLRGHDALHHAPEDGCSCGIYAYREPAKLVGLCRTYANRYQHQNIVFGEVDVWGRYWRHADAWRAQFAVPSAFYVFEPYRFTDRELLDRAAYQFDVPLVRFDVPPLPPA